MAKFIERFNHDLASIIDDDGTVTDYAAHGGLLCKVVNRGRGQGDQFFEVCAHLALQGPTVPVPPGADVAKILRKEAAGRFGKLEIRERQ